MELGDVCFLVQTILLCLLNPGNTQQSCISLGVPYNDENRRQALPLTSQAIVPTYKFQCCGTVTSWRAYLQPGGKNHRNAYNISFQVWRPSEQLSDHYSLVQQTVAVPTLTNDGEAIVPASAGEIVVQPEDVVGFYVQLMRDGDGGIQLDTTQTGEHNIWYSVNFPPQGYSQPVQTGAGTSLSMVQVAAPMLEVDVLDMTCPSTATVEVPTVPSTTAPATLPEVSSDENRMTAYVNTASDFQVWPTTTTDKQKAGSNSVDGSTELFISSSSSLSAAAVAIVVVVVVLLVVTIITAPVVILIVVMKKRNKKEIISTSDKDIINPNYYPKWNSNGIKFQQSKEENKYDYISLTGVPYHRIKNEAEDGVGNCGNKLSAAEASSSCATRSYDIVGDSSGDIDSEYNLLENNYSEVENRDIHSEYSLLENNFAEVESNESKKQQDEERMLYDVPCLIVPGQRERGQKDYEEVKTYHKLSFSQSEENYWAPAGTPNALYDQLASKKYREILRKDVIVQQELGSGQFGKVCKALWTVSGTSLETAIKQLKSSAASHERVKLLQEAAIMGQFHHTHVVKLYGLITIVNPVTICLEFMSKGDLQHYLVSVVSKCDSPSYGLKEWKFFFVKAAVNIASGMKYLASKAFIHRDLAARNILMNEANVCKIGDFGMARDLKDSTYYTSTEDGKIPIRWTSPEALFYRKYSSASDVWSFGMLLYEIWSVGKRPFPNLRNAQVLAFLEKSDNGGHDCQPPPPGCPRAMYKLMVDCWNPATQKRPKFAEILTYLQQPTVGLLYWSPGHSQVLPGSDVIGNDIHHSERLYLDLQKKYAK